MSSAPATRATPPPPRGRPCALRRNGPNEIAFPSTGRVSAATAIAQLIQKLFGHDQIGGSETLGKPVVDRLKAGDGVAMAALFAQQAGEAGRSAQLPGQGALLARRLQRPMKISFRRLRICRVALQGE